MKRTLSLLLVLALCLAFIPLREARANDEPISSVTLSITPPIEGAGPDYSPVLTGANDRYFSDSYNTDTYHNDVVWRDMTKDEDLKVAEGRFDSDHTYRVMIFLTPDVGYEFTSSTTATINGITADKYLRSDGQLLVWLIFSEVLRYIDAGMYDVQINISDPVVGEYPDYEPTLLYTQGMYSLKSVLWQDITDSSKPMTSSDTFQKDHHYRVYVYLKPKEGYCFESDMNGNIGSHSATFYRMSDGRGRFHCDYGAPLVPLDSVVINITAPAAGKAPSYTFTVPSGSHYGKSDELGFEESISWYDVDSDTHISWWDSDYTFKAGHTYTVDIIVDPEEGYCFKKGIKGTINGISAAHIDGSFACTFPALPAPTYTVTLDPNGGTCSKSSVTVTYGKAYGTLPTPTRTGYTFKGWWTAKTGGKQVTASTVCYATGNYTLYARWEPKTFTVALNPNGGTCSKTSVTVTYDKAYGTLPTPMRSGYIFIGWWTTKDSGGKQVTASTVCKATGNFTLYARWTASKTYTVTLNPNGGSCTTSSLTVTYGAIYGPLPAATRTGYTFAGWWTTKDTGGKQVTASTVCYASGNYTLYARWTPKTYTVTLNANGGTCSKSSITVTYDKAYGTMPTPTRTGYTFAGWWTTKDSGGKQVTASTVCKATGNFTLYARWTAKTFTVTLNPNGGTCSKSIITVTYDKAYGTLPTPTRTGYTFAGWWTTKDSGGKQVTATTVCKATGNFTLYARWTAKTYTVTLNANGGTCSKSSITVTYDKAYGTLPTPTRTGYTFAGWWTTKDSGGKQVTASTVCKATGNFTLYARWTAKTFTVTLNPNGGTCSKSSITVTYDKAYGTLPTPTRSGYTFKGWWTAKDSGGKQVTKDTVCKATGNYTLYARWKQN